MLFAYLSCGGVGGVVVVYVCRVCGWNVRSVGEAAWVLDEVAVPGGGDGGGGGADAGLLAAEVCRARSLSLCAAQT